VRNSSRVTFVFTGTFSLLLHGLLKNLHGQKKKHWVGGGGGGWGVFVVRFSSFLLDIKKQDLLIPNMVSKIVYRFSFKR